MGSNNADRMANSVDPWSAMLAMNNLFQYLIFFFFFVSVEPDIGGFMIKAYWDNLILTLFMSSNLSLIKTEYCLIYSLSVQKYRRTNLVTLATPLAVWVKKVLYDG